MHLVFIHLLNPNTLHIDCRCQVKSFWNSNFHFYWTQHEKCIYTGTNMPNRNAIIPVVAPKILKEYSVNFSTKYKHAWQKCSRSCSSPKDFKGIFSDFRNIFLWHESEDVNQKSLFPTFQLMPILRFQVMHDYVCFLAPVDYCVE